MTKNKELFYWQENDDWYDCDENGNVSFHTDAPERAKKSYEMWQQHQQFYSDSKNL